MKHATGGLVLLVLLAAAPLQGAAGVVRLTDNDVNDVLPCASGTNLAWTRARGSGTELIREVVFYDGNETIVLKLGDDNSDPRLSGSNVVWTSRTEGEPAPRVALYDGHTVRSLWQCRTNGPAYDISGSHVVWTDGVADATLPEIFSYDGHTITRLTSNDVWELNLTVSGPNVAWTVEREGWGNDVFLYDGRTTTQLTPPDGPAAGYWIRLSGSHVVWHAPDSEFPYDDEIFFYDGSKTIQLTHNDYWDRYPEISGSRVVWTSNAPYDANVFLYDGDEVSGIGGGADAWISGDYVVTRGSRAHRGIQYYDGHTWTRFFEPWEGAPLDFSFPSVVWSRSDGHDDEIMLFVIPEPSTLALLDMGAGVLASCTWCRRRRRV